MTAFKDDSLKKNKWYFTVEIKENGKRKRIKRRGFRTEKIAKDAERKLLNDLDKGLNIYESTTIYNDYMNDWLKDKKNKVKQGTYENYDSLIRNHILPSLGELPLIKITPRHIQNLYNHLKDSNSLSGENIQKVHTIIKGSLQKAVDWDMLIKNPASVVERPTAVVEEMKYWTHKESVTFLNASKNSRYYYIFLLGITTGMRQGEILGLHWNDVNFEEKSISIRGTLDHQGKKFQPSTKTKSGMRTVGIDSHTANELQKLKQRTLNEKMKNRDIYEDNDLVFATELGNFVNPRNMLRAFYNLITVAEVPKIRFHDLRHTHVVFLLEMRENSKRIAERLGWSSVKMLDRYSHVSPHMQKDTADAFGDKFFSAPNGTE
ncbi:site-specific integrase [Alkalicoccobacillus murimartini]|uniref:Integrase n=1 Tax=Alkalicoccobacillus murimartini TaxID=171685 RepID=A0ABT9YM10_9BACI|nr:site-specific integrase [Alkalicoccobacillus murimartini]MDQ0208892.1 integrase [Alkalicoccobacillus murimartini]